MIRVLDGGLYTTVQDLGRYGFERFGISPSGALDDYSFRLGNIFLNNDENTPQIEITLKGPILEFLVDKIITIVGGEIEAFLNENKIPNYRPIYVKKGSILSLNEIKKGMRSYLIIQGGVKVKKFLDSYSYDKFLKKGVILKKGDLIELNDLVDSQVLERKFYDEFKLKFDQKLRVILGPDIDRFKDESKEKFFSLSWRVSEKSDRVAIRLDGEKLKFKEKKETIISEGVNTGTIQVPPDGRPIVLLKDRPTTGGYPKIGNLISVDIPVISQKRFNELISFEEVSLEEANKLFFEREEKINLFKMRLGKLKRFYISFKGEKHKVSIEEMDL